MKNREIIFEEGVYGTDVYLCKNKDVAKDWESSYMHANIELTKEQLMRIINGEVFIAIMNDSYSLSISVTAE